MSHTKTLKDEHPIEKQLRKGKEYSELETPLNSVMMLSSTSMCASSIQPFRAKVTFHSLSASNVNKTASQPLHFDTDDNLIYCVRLYEFYLLDSSLSFLKSTPPNCFYITSKQHLTSKPHIRR